MRKICCFVIFLLLLAFNSCIKFPSAVNVRNNEYFKIISEISEGKANIVTEEPKSLVYLTCEGDYAGTFKVWNDVIRILNEMEIKSNVGYIRYYHMRGEVPMEKQISEVGYIVDNIPKEKMDKLRTRMKVRTMNKQQFIFFEAPFKGPEFLVQNSQRIYSSIVNAYKKRNATEKLPPKGEKNYVMEIYDGNTGTIRYLFEILDWNTAAKL